MTVTYLTKQVPVIAWRYGDPTVTPPADFMTRKGYKLATGEVVSEQTASARTYGLGMQPTPVNAMIDPQSGLLVEIPDGTWVVGTSPGYYKLYSDADFAANFEVSSSS